MEKIRKTKKVYLKYNPITAPYKKLENIIKKYRFSINKYEKN